jgi:hypothetical protein
MNWKKLSLTLPLFAISSLQAFVEREIDEKRPIPVVFSTTSHNRISVDGASVEKIIADSGVFSVILERNTGNAFVNVLKAGIDKPLTLTLVTSSGLIQDFLVTSSEGASEQVVLKEKRDVDEEFIQGRSLHAPTIDLLNHILEGKTPLGYGQRAVDDKDFLALPKPLAATPVKAFEGTFETIMVYKLMNEGEKPIVLTSDSFKKENDSWVFLNAHELGQGQHALCVIANSKNRT